MLMKIEEETEVENMNEHGPGGHDPRQQAQHLARQGGTFSRNGSFQPRPEQAEGQRQGHEHGHAGIELEPYVQRVGDMPFFGDVGQKKIQKRKPCGEKQRRVHQNEQGDVHHGLKRRKNMTAETHNRSFWGNPPRRGGLRRECYTRSAYSRSRNSSITSSIWLMN